MVIKISKIQKTNQTGMLWIFIPQKLRREMNLQKGESVVVSIKREVKK